MARTGWFGPSLLVLTSPDPMPGHAHPCSCPARASLMYSHHGRKSDDVVWMCHAFAGFVSYSYASTVCLDAAAMLATHNTHVRQARLVGA